MNSIWAYNWSNCSRFRIISINAALRNFIGFSMLLELAQGFELVTPDPFLLTWAGHGLGTQLHHSPTLQQLTIMWHGNPRIWGWSYILVICGFGLGVEVEVVKPFKCFLHTSACLSQCPWEIRWGKAVYFYENIFLHSAALVKMSSQVNLCLHWLESCKWTRVIRS